MSEYGEGRPVTVPRTSQPFRARTNVVAALVDTDPAAVLPHETQGWVPRRHDGTRHMPGDANSVRDARGGELRAYLELLRRRVEHAQAEQRWRDAIWAVLARNWGERMDGQTLAQIMAALPPAERGEVDRLLEQRPGGRVAVADVCGDELAQR